MSLIFSSMVALISSPVGYEPVQAPIRMTSIKREGRNAVCEAFLPSPSGRSPLAKYAFTKLKDHAELSMAGFLKENRGSVSSRKATLDYRTKISMDAPNVVSIYATIVTDTGGAHPLLSYHTANYGILNGKPSRLNLQDLFRKDVNADVEMNTLLMQRLRDMKATWILNSEVKEIVPALLEKFVLTPSGISWFFAPYETGPWSDGTRIVKVAFTELKEKLDPQFTSPSTERRILKPGQ